MAPDHPEPERSHSFIRQFIFTCKSRALIAKRLVQNIITTTHTGAYTEKLWQAPCTGHSITPLWPADDHEKNWLLTAGKVQNLRVAVQKINGLELPAGATFSFWQHIGRPSKSRGFVTGREIREGCIIPTTGGGLCQLSNALYDAALKSGLEILERHRHTKIIAGSLAEQNRDATVKWNYVDLRFRSAHAFRIEAQLSGHELIIRIKTHAPAKAPAQTTAAQTGHILNDCYSCGKTGCNRQQRITQPPVMAADRRTAFILDEAWPEYKQYVRQTAGETDFYIVPFHQFHKKSIGRYTWNVGSRNQAYSFRRQAVKRTLLTRWCAKRGNNIPSLLMRCDAAIVNSLRRRIPVNCTHIVISQNQLPFAWQAGLLGGRSYDVLMMRYPMTVLERQLDTAYSLHPGSPTLTDYRANAACVRAETEALQNARRIITPHTGIAALFAGKVEILPWHKPSVQLLPVVSGIRNGSILFPASPLGRKGCYEVKRLAMELGLNLIFTGDAEDTPGFWGTVTAVKAGTGLFENISLVLLPAFTLQRPDVLLKALAKGIPVITTPAAGLPPQKGLHIVQAGNYTQIKKMVMELLKIYHHPSAANPQLQLHGMEL